MLSALYRIRVLGACCVALGVVLQVAAAGEEAAVKEVKRTAFLNIRVVNKQGAPVPRALVHLYFRRNRVKLLTGRFGEPYRTIECDDQGWANVGPLEPGEGYYASMIVQRERYPGLGKRLSELVLKPGRNEHVVVYETPAGGGVRGSLTDKQGRPLSGVTVRLAPNSWVQDRKKLYTCGPMRARPTCTTDANGAFWFSGVRSHGDSKHAVTAVKGLDILFVDRPCTIPPGGQLNLGQITTELKQKDFAAGPN